jgi:predicted nucleic-acid-binding Zn-ribbon protein
MVQQGLMRAMAFITKDEDSEYDNINSKCPKCSSGDMIEHPSFLSVTLTSRSKIAEKVKTAIEDQDADFVFKSISSRNRAYAEFYLVTDDTRRRVYDLLVKCSRTRVIFPSKVQIDTVP